MQKNNNEKVLTCFCRNSNDLLISSYNLSDFSNIGELTKIIYEVNPRYVLSVISNDKTASLVCYLKGIQYMKCDKYDINKNERK